MMAPRTTSLVVLAFLLSNCTKDKGFAIDGSNYPKEVSVILLSKCAVSGCHNSLSKDAAAGLSLASWDALFEGARGGAAVIPYRPDFSTLCYFTNSFPDLGPEQSPKMPINGPALSREEYLSLTNWIAKGAPSFQGEVKFSETKNKLYVTNQLCDLVMVLDGESMVAMRCLNVGATPKSEFPVCVKVSPDGGHVYVSFLASHNVQKFNATNDVYQGQIELGPGVWSSFEIGPDSKSAFFVDNSNPGKIAFADLDKPKVTSYYASPDLIYPRSPVFHQKNKKIYLGAENGNYLSVLDISNPETPVLKRIILDGSSAINTAPSIDPVFLLLNETEDLCFVCCRNSKEIKLISTSKDTVVGTVPLTSSPTYLAYDAARRNLFISCMDDSVTFHDNLGSVQVLSLQSGLISQKINTGCQPNGLSVNSAKGYLAVVNSNISPKGPRPHHTSACAGRNGYVSYVNLNNLQLITKKKTELAVYPASIALKK